MHTSLTDILRSRFQVPDETVAEAVRAAGETGGDLGEILLRRNAVSEQQLLQAYGEQLDIPFLPDLPLDSFDLNFTKQVPIQFLKRHGIVPLIHGKEPEPGRPETTVIAIHHPSGLPAVDDLVRELDLDRYAVVLSSKAAILSAINIAYDLNRDSAQQLVQDIEDSGSIVIQELGDSADLLDDTSDAPIIRLVNHVISQAVKARASDIHIEPYEDNLKVRYRVDGILYELLKPPKWIQLALASRVKVMSSLNIAEKRLPQDGRMGVRVGNRDIDVRVSTIPTSFGERIVLRLLNKTGSFLSMTELGLDEIQLAYVNRLVKSSNGIILVTGPTGSGKTTTLYAILSSINSPDINIITIEDPVEYQIQGISQIQVNPKIDLTFARGLRSIVRQDPDVILVGEIRDTETADIAVQSALTGHLVFSTLHTNDSAGAVTRLVDIGVEPFLISSSLLAVAAQRLVRVLCEKCRQRYEPAPDLLEQVAFDTARYPSATFFRSTGCEDCFHTGFKGRLGIFEIMELNEKLKGLILRAFDANRIKQEALRAGMRTLREDGLKKAAAGITTIEEVLRVTNR